MSILTPEETHSDLKALAKLAETLPSEIQTTLKGVIQQLNKSLNYKTRILRKIQEDLGQIRLDIKYLMFDLESTRDERDKYKRQLEK